MPDYTLTDVMVGLHKHDLINILTDEEWTFLTGLILYANERGFKNPIDLAVKQATHAGGGNSRQSVNRRRNSLAKIKINGKPILTVVAGKPGQKLVATYEIDYNLICSYNSVWYSENEGASQKRDGKRTQGGRRADGGRDLPKIRSEEIRSSPPTPFNVSTKQVSSETEEVGGGLDSSEEDSGEDAMRESLLGKYKTFVPKLFRTLGERDIWEHQHTSKYNHQWSIKDLERMLALAEKIVADPSHYAAPINYKAYLVFLAERKSIAELPDSSEELRMIQKAKRIQDLILRKWRMQIPEGPDIGACKAALREFGCDHKLLEEAITQAPMTLTHPAPGSALSLVCVKARKIQSEGNGPVTHALLAEREREIDGLKADLKQARKNPDDNATFISQHEHILKLKESALERLKTE